MRDNNIDSNIDNIIRMGKVIAVEEQIKEKIDGVKDDICKKKMNTEIKADR